ncbi:MAG: hypothetical protein GHCLOJNM_00464 [bacterium]|nr:hypothetical protein [bacterium]
MIWMALFAVTPVFAEQALLRPVAGDQFQIHQDIVCSGTYSLSGFPSGRFHQEVGIDFAATVHDSPEPPGSWRANYRFDRFRILSRIEGATETYVEIEPGRLVIDGTTVYDRNLRPDESVPILCHLLLEDLSATFSARGEVLRFEERKSMRNNFPFLELTQALRETWIELPERPLAPGLQWREDRPARILSDRIVVPASQTYSVQAVPEGDDQPAVLAFERAIDSRRPRRFPIPIGSSTPLSLRYNAIGPDLLAPPQELLILSLSISSKGNLEYRRDWKYMSHKETRDWIGVTMEVPRPDGTEVLTKKLLFDRVIRTTVERRTGSELSEEARGILFGE